MATREELAAIWESVHGESQSAPPPIFATPEVEKSPIGNRELPIGADYFSDFIEGAGSGLPGINYVRAAGKTAGQNIINPILNFLTRQNIQPQSFKENLANSFQQEKELFKKSPVLANLGMLAGASVIPLRAAEKAEKALSSIPGVKGAILRTLAKTGALGAEGALLGGAYAAGSEEGNMTEGALAGGIGAPVLNAVFKAPGVGIKVLSALKDAIAPDVAQKGGNVAMETFQKYVPDVSGFLGKLTKKDTSPFAGYQTVAEKTKEPGVALLTKVMQKEQPLVRESIGAAEEARRAARNLMYDEAQGPYTTPSNIGAQVRTGLEEAKTTLKDKVGSAFTKASKGQGTIPVARAKIELADRIRAERAKGRSIDSGSSQIIRAFQKSPQNPNVPQFLFQRQSVGEMVGDLKSNLSGLSSKEKTGYRILSGLAKSLDEAEELATTINQTTKSGIQKGITGKQRQNLLKGRELRKSQGVLFENQGVGKILKKDKFGEYKIVDSKALSKAYDSPENAEQIMTALGRDEFAKQKVRADFLERMKDKTFNPNTNKFNSETFVKNWNRSEETAKKILTPTQRKAIKVLGQDFISEGEFERLASQATKKQSVTSEHLSARNFLAKTIAMGSRLKLGPLAGFFDKIGAHQAKKIEQNANEILMSLILDESAAKDFLTKQLSAQTKKSLTSKLLDVLKRIEQKGEKTLPAIIGLSQNA